MEQEKRKEFETWLYGKDGKIEKLAKSLDKNLAQPIKKSKTYKDLCKKGETPLDQLILELRKPLAEKEKECKHENMILVDKFVRRKKISTGDNPVEEYVPDLLKIYRYCPDCRKWFVIKDTGPEEG